MKKFLCLIFTILSFGITKVTFSNALVGEISKAEFLSSNSPQVIDIDTKLPISGAIVSIPSEITYTTTNSSGVFSIHSSKTGSIILAVKKDGYKPFSLTINASMLNQPFKIELQKQTPYQIVISDNLIHLGDNSFSYNSANASEFRGVAVGPVYKKDFYIKNNLSDKKIYITFGSLLGLDTIQAMSLGQNRLSNSVSSPSEIYINGQKIGELKINGDNQKIPIPKNLLNSKSKNTLSIHTGQNLDNTGFVDYDDIEIVNLFIDEE